MLGIATRFTCSFAALAGIVGCSSGSKIVPVSGIVLIDGHPLTHGKIQVAPAGERPAFAVIGPDGRFTLSTYGQADGVAIGTHPFAVVAHETLGPSSTKWHAPKKYASTETSGLTMTVEKATNDIVVNLSWDGGKPFIVHGQKE